MTGPTPQAVQTGTSGGRSYVTARLLDQMPLATLFVLCLAVSLLSDRFLSPLNLNNILLQVSIMAIVTMGMTFVIISGGFDLSVGSVVATSGCVSAWVMLETNVPVGMIAGIGVGVLIGLINGLVITRLRVSPFIATLGTMVVVRGVALLITGGRPIVGEDGLPESFLEIGRGSFLGIHYLIWIPLVTFAGLAWILHMTPYGRRIFAAGGNNTASFLAGIPCRSRGDQRICLVRRSGRTGGRSVGLPASVRTTDGRRVL